MTGNLKGNRKSYFKGICEGSFKIKPHTRNLQENLKCALQGNLKGNVKGNWKGNWIDSEYKNLEWNLKRGLITWNWEVNLKGTTQIKLKRGLKENVKWNPNLK